MDGNLFYNPSTGTLNATIFDGSFNGNALTATTATTATTADTATKVTVTDNESTPEDNLIVFVGDAQSSSGSQDLEMDGNLFYNPSTGTLNATIFDGSFNGNALTTTTATTATTADTATVATTVTITANTSVAENNLIAFVEDTETSGDHGLEADEALTYNPSTGTLNATIFDGSFNGNATTATTATNITVATTSSVSCSVALFTSATGNLEPKTDPGLTYDANANTLTVGNNIEIADSGTIGSASDADAISISSTGVVTISANVASTDQDDGALVVSNGGVGIEGNLNVGGTLTAGTIAGTPVPAPLTVDNVDPGDGNDLTTATCHLLNALNANRTYKIPGANSNRRAN